jgi:DUF4097 and DUF4098 domain-containing protein YvlB
MRDQMRAQARAQRDAFRAQREQMRYQMRGMRRGSILGPLLLIAVGVVFLLIQTGRIDRSRFWAWYGHWWPLLLVCAGLVVLAEWGLDQFLMHDPQQPRFRRSLGVGVSILLLIFVFTGFVASEVHDFPSGYSKLFPGYHFDQDSLDELFGDKHESDQNLDLSFNAGSSLDVVNPRGDVTVSGTSDDNRIHVSVHKQIYARSDSEADTKAQQFVPNTSAVGSTFNLTMPSLDGARADLVITVPASAVTTVTANHGDIHIASIKAAVNATANRGDIELSAITGSTTAHVNSGGASITARSIDGGIAIQGRAEGITLAEITGPATINGEFFGTTHLEHINGSVHFHTSRTDFQLARLDGEVEISPDSNLSADQVLGPVVLTTRERNITLERVAGDISVTNRNGTVDLTAAPVIGGKLGAITIENRNGSIRATLPEQAGFLLRSDTTDGDIDTNFLPQPGGQDEGKPGSGRENHKVVNATVGSGGPIVLMTTTNGDISIQKGNVPPLPLTTPAPPKITLVPPAPPARPVKAAVMPKHPATPKQEAAPSSTNP